MMTPPTVDKSFDADNADVLEIFYELPLFTMSARWGVNWPIAARKDEGTLRSLGFLLPFLFFSPRPFSSPKSTNHPGMIKWERHHTAIHYIDLIHSQTRTLICICAEKDLT